MNVKQYGELVKRRAARSPVLKNTVAAYLTGGAICLFGEALRRAYLMLGAEEKSAPLLVTVTLIALAVLATGLGVFDTVARVAGAGIVLFSGIRSRPYSSSSRRHCKFLRSSLCTELS